MAVGRKDVVSNPADLVADVDMSAFAPSVATLESSADLVTIHDADGALLSVSRAAETMLGANPHKLRGQPGHILAHPDERRAFDSFISSGVGLFTFRAVHSDGHGVLLEVSAARTQTASGPVTVCISRDVGERRRAEEFVQILQAVSVAANVAENAAVALAVTLKEMCALLGWPVGHAYIVIGWPGETLVPSGVWHFDNPEPYAGFRSMTESIRFSRGDFLPGVVLDKGAPVWVSDIADDVRFRRASAVTDDGPVRSAFACPVMAGEDVVAVLEFYNDRVVPPDDRLVDLAIHVGTQLGRVFEREHAAEELEDRAVQLEGANQALEAAHLQQEHLLQVATHELRSPLTSMKGFIEMLQDTSGRAPEHMREEFVSRLGRQVERMAALVERLLTTARIDAGALEPVSHDVDVAAIAKAVAMDHHAIGEVVAAVPAEPVFAKGDPQFIEQVVTNLVTNSLKHGGAPVTILVRDAAEAIEIAVQDSGPGVPDEFVPRLFDRFAQHDPAAGRGSGLGLSIAQGLLAAMGGSVHYEHGQPHGARFVVRLPHGDSQG